MNLLETYGPLLSKDWGLAYKCLSEAGRVILVSKSATAVMHMDNREVWTESQKIDVAPFDCDSEAEFVRILSVDTEHWRRNGKEVKFLVPPGVVSRRQDRDSHIPEKPANQEPPMGIRETLTSIEGGTV